MFNFKTKKFERPSKQKRKEIIEAREIFINEFRVHFHDLVKKENAKKDGTIWLLNHYKRALNMLLHEWAQRAKISELFQNIK